jgi:hypothetical protein
MKRVGDFFSPTAITTLYHYTGVGALLGIVESGSVWASHVYYMNDSKEIVHACDVLNEILRPRAKEFSGEDQIFVQQFADWLETFRHNGYHLFVFALSQEKSLLSQWRSYTPHGRGVSLGLSPSALNHFLAAPGFRLAQCLYEQHEHVELMSALLEKLLITFRQRLPSLDMSDRHPSQKYHGFLEEFRGEVLQVLAIVKHSAFREEREWRIVSPYFPKYTVPEVKFRGGASMLLPYIELPLPKSESPKIFDEVILGPSGDVSLSLAALSAFLSNKRVCDMTVNSQIPLRKWPAT